MKTKLFFPGAAALSLVLIFTACKKEDRTEDKTPPTSLEVATHVDDETLFSSENDALADDALAALNQETSINGRIIPSVCNASYDIDSLSNPRKITITYDGKTCDNKRTRTGVLVLSMPSQTRWKDAGAILTVNFNNIKITRLADNKSIVLNGTQTYTNVSGGLLKNLASLQSITHTINSNGMEVNFDNETKRSWKVARKRVFTYNNGVVITLSGNHTEGDKTNIAEWGTNRYGRTFTGSTLEPVVIRQDCNFRIVSGKVQNVQSLVTTIFTFGLDATGTAVSCPSGTYYGKLEWVIGNQSSSVILPY